MLVELFQIILGVSIILFITNVAMLFKCPNKKGSDAITYKKRILIFFIICMIGATGLIKEDDKTKQAVSTKNVSSSISEANSIKEKDNRKNNKLKIHYINVGQGDSILIQQNGHNMLIDAGDNENCNALKQYLCNQGVDKLDFLVGTHPHEDHIGGMDYIINSFKVGKIYMPKVTANTKTFKDVVASAKEHKLKFTNPKVGESFKLGDANLTVVAPKSTSYENLNDYSIVLKLRFGSNSFLFTGDAQATSEMEMIKSNADIYAEVLKVGHHGSKTSTVTNFLNKVNPKYAIVSLGKDNKYNHPSESVMKRLKAKGVKVYRTDENGTIVVTSDGENITFNCKPASYNGHNENINQKTSKSKSSKITAPSKSSNRVTKTNPSVNVNQRSVWISETGKKYHSKPNCGNMNPNRATKMTVQEAECRGYGPCSKCFN